MGRLFRVARALVSVLLSVVVILFLYGYLSPYGLDPSKLFGSSYASFLGGTLGSTPGGGSILTGTYAPFLPGGAAGLIIYTLMRKMGSVTQAATAPNLPSANEMMSRMNMPNYMGGMMGAQASVPASLPPDITRSQFAVLSSIRRGISKPGAIAKSLSMEKKDVETDTAVLISNGYLSKGSKLTSKGMDLLGS